MATLDLNKINKPPGDPLWRGRELARFAAHEYEPLPDVGLEFEAEHFLHLSTKPKPTDPTMVAYTASAEKGERDIQTRLRFGRYLKKHFTSMADHEIEDKVKLLRSYLHEQTYKLEFWTTRKQMNEIFETEMCACGGEDVSCMYGKFKGDNRPYHVYADSPDVAVAVLLQGDEIVGRSVVNQVKKHWVRLYATDDFNETRCIRLRTMLEAAGYDKGDLENCRISKVYSDRYNKLLLPYIDGGTQSISEGDNWLYVLEEGDWAATRTDGIGDWCGKLCNECGEHLSEEDANETRDGNVCDDCLSEHYTLAYVRSDEQAYVYKRRAVTACDGNLWARFAVDEWGVGAEVTHHAYRCTCAEEQEEAKNELTNASS